MVCTPKMKDFAMAIAEELCLDYPDWENFSEVSKFIDEHKEEYYESRRIFG